MHHQPALEQVISLLAAAWRRATNNGSLKREPDAVDLPRGKGQLLPRQPAGGEKEGERRALVAFTVAETW